MLETLVVAAGIGFLLGLRYRVTVVIIASAGVAVAAVAIARSAGASLWGILAALGGAIVALQCGYLGGLLMTLGAPHSRSSEDQADHPAQGQGVNGADGPAPLNRTASNGVDRGRDRGPNRGNGPHESCFVGS